MHHKLAVLTGKVEAHGVQVDNFGMVDNALGAAELLPRLKAADLDLVFVDMVTYATSSTVGAILRGLDVPLVLVALQPLAAMDYERASTYMQLCNDDFCSVPEFPGVAIRMGRRPPDVILGTLEDDPGGGRRAGRLVPHRQGAARPAPRPDRPHGPRARSHARHAHRPDGGHRRLRLPRRAVRAGRDPAALPRRATPPEIEAEAARDPGLLRHARPEVRPDHDEADRARTCTMAAKAAVALEKFIADRQLDGLAYYYEAEAGTPMREMVTNLIVGNSLLTGAGFPMCGEYDLKTCIAMLIMDRLDIGGSFAEFHPGRFRARHGAGRARRPAPRQHRRPEAGAAQPAEVPRQARGGRERRVQHQGRPDHDAQHRREGRRASSSSSSRRASRCAARSRRRATRTRTAGSPGRADVPETLGGRRPDAPFRARHRPPRRRAGRLAGVLGIECAVVSPAR